MEKMESAAANYMAKHPRAQIILNILGGVFILVVVWVKRQELVDWDLNGGELYMPRFVYWIYSVGGANAPAILFSLVSLIFFFKAYRIFRGLKQK